MFTGIIQSQAILDGKKSSRGQIQLTFQILGKKVQSQLGESVAIDGVCLTVTSFRNKKFSADVIPETLRSTTLGNLQVGQRVNVERSLRVGDALGGHWVTGHVDGVGRIQTFERWGGNFCLKIKISAPMISLLVPKGSIAIDGISFTLQKIHSDSFEVGVIPHTYRTATLSHKRVGDTVNLEADLLAKLVQKFISGEKSRDAATVPLREKNLKRQGF